MNQANTTVPTGVILIADDNPEARRMLDVRVKREGHQTILVGNGLEALQELARQKVDVVLLDIDMPELDGYGALSAIKNDPLLADIPVIIISGGGDQDDLVRCIEMGAVDYLPKPFNQALLRARITACLSQRKPSAQRQDTPFVASGEITDDVTELNMTSQWPLLPVVQPLAPRPATPAMPKPTADTPARVGRIVLKELLGVGGMGKVYLGHHELLEMPVAVKILRAEFTSTPAIRARLLQEARVAARITHRHIVRLIEIGEFNQNVYLAFEYVVGGNLAEYLQRQPESRVSLETALRIATEVVHALAEAHQQGIIHRDIKPANLLLTQDGTIKVGDFGLARQYKDIDPAMTRLTIEGSVSGTPMYMAPEQLIFGSPLDVRTDLYALGCVLYEMLVGHSPFGCPAHLELPDDMEHLTKNNISFHHVNTPAPPPTRFRAEIPAWLENVCMKLLSKAPDDRFQTPDELLQALQTQSA